MVTNATTAKASKVERAGTARSVGRGLRSAPWPSVPIHRIARHHSGNSKLIKGKLHDAQADNLFPAFSASGQDVWHSEFDREGDAIIISAVGARCGKCFLARGRWSAIANTHVVWPDPARVDLKFLWYLLNDEQFWIRSGSAQPFVAVRKTFEKEIVLPPLSEQRQIVAEIEKQFTRLDVGVAALRRVQTNLKRYRAAVLKPACEGKLVPTEAELSRQKGRLPAPRPAPFCIYAIRCNDDSIYIGHTDDLPRRWSEHQCGQGAEWTKCHKPVAVVHVEDFETREAAVAREKWLKTGFGRKWLKREIAAGRARQAGLVPTEAELARKEGRSFESGEVLHDRILTERRQNWQGRGSYRDPTDPDPTKLPPTPDGWAWANFDQVTTLITKGSSPNWQGFNYCDDGIVFVRSENVRWGTLDLDGGAHLPPAFNEKERKSILREGDVLLNLVGASIGRAAVATREVEGGNVNQAVAVIRLAVAKTMNQFAVLWLNSTEAQKRIHAEKVDVARANFSLEDTRVLPVPLPPFAEQTRIVAEVERRMSVADELEAAVSANLQRSFRLRQAVSTQTFTSPRSSASKTQ